MRRRIRAFHHQSIRSILRINMHMVEKCRIKNPTICQWFCNTPCILDIAKKRQLDWIGKVARMEETKIQRQLLMSWTSNPRKSGHLQISPRNTYAQVIHNMIHLYDPIQGVAKKWTAQAKNKATWAKLTNTWWESNARSPIEEAMPNMETTIQRYYSDHYCRPLLLTVDRYR
jgi:hypothetical protein